MVIKFNPAGRVVMVLGRRPEQALGVVETPTGAQPPARKYIFARPTDVAFDARGNIFVSDGYFNHRVVKYDSNGKFLRQVGSERSGSEPSQMNTPHTIATDAQGNVYVGDRGNARVQVFDTTRVRAIYDNVRSLGDLHLAGPAAISVRLNSNPDAQPAASWEITGEIYR